MMTEVRPNPVAVNCTGDLRPATPSFRDLFELHHALEELVTIAVKTGVPLNPAAATEQLLLNEAFSTVSRREIQQALLQAAARAGVPTDGSGADQ